jgi:hypothetical protein
MNPELLAALKTILEKCQWLEDEGPTGEGWQSDALSGALALVREAVEEEEKRTA